MLEKLKGALKSTLIYGVGNLSVKLIGFVLLPLYTTYLPVSDYGVLALFESISQILIAVCSLNLTSALFRWYWDSRYKDRQRSMFFTSLIFSIALAGIMMALVILVAPDISKVVFGTTDWSGVVMLMVGFSAMEIVISIPSTLIRLQERPGLFTTAMVIRLVTNLLGTVVLIVYVSPTVDSIYIAQLIGGCVYLLVLAPYILRNLEMRFETTLLVEMIAYSFPLVLGSISTILVSFADRYILKLYGALADVGIYSLGFKIANTVLFVVISVQLALSPMIYKAIDEPESKRFFSKILTYLSFAIMWLVLAVSVFGVEIVKALAQNPAYWPASTLIPIVCFSIFFGMAKDSVATGIIVQRNTKLLSIISAVMAAGNLVFDILLIPKLGITGAAWASLLTQFLAFTIFYRAAQKEYFIPYELRKVGSVVFVGVVLVLLAHATSDWSLLARLPAKFLLLASFPLSLLAFRFYDEIEVLRLREAFHKWKHVNRWGSYLRNS